MHSVQIAKGGEILSLVVDISRGIATWIATGTRDKCVQVWLFDSSGQMLQSVHSKAYGNDKSIVPKALTFADNKAKDLYIFSLYDGGL